MPQMFRALRSIHAGEEILVEYGAAYWDANGTSSADWRASDLLDCPQFPRY